MGNSYAYQQITDRIIAMLEQGTIPWRKPWRTRRLPHQNMLSKRPYSGINYFLLACSDYHSPYWLTMKQVNDCGGCVRKGEKATRIIFTQMIEAKTSETDSITLDAEDKNMVPIIKFYNIFNLEQTIGVEAEYIPEDPEPNSEFTPLAEAELIVSRYADRPPVVYCGDQAYYSLRDDRIQIPRPEMYPVREEFYSTLFHELIHSTGHPKRLNRESLKDTEEDAYSKEELVAEMGAAFLCDQARISAKTLENSGAYIQGWLSRLRNDKSLVIRAAAAAQKAADYVNGIQQAHQNTPAVIDKAS